MYSVWYSTDGGPTTCVFTSEIPTQRLADKIAADFVKELAYLGIEGVLAWAE